MAGVTINADGSITVTLTEQEKSLAVLIRDEDGAATMTEVLSLWLQNKGQAVMATRFNRLNPADQAATLAKLTAARLPVLVP